MEILEKIQLSPQQKRLLAKGEMVEIPASHDEFLDFISDTHYKKFEYANGHLIIMGVASFFHELIVTNLISILTSIYQDKSGYLTLGSSLGIVIPEQKNYHQADVSVIFGKPTFRDKAQTELENPYLVMEVLSKSTSQYDVTTKLHNYKKIPSLKQVFLIDQYTTTVSSYTRSDDGKIWLNIDYDKLDDAVVIDSYTVLLKDIYRNVL